jgi:hypothetical protein
VRRLEAFLYSRRNIAGTLLALGGLALYFAGITGGIAWLPITIGLYLIGYLLVPGEQGLSIQLGAAEDAAEVREGLTRLLRGIKGKVADDLYAKVVSIQASILGTLTWKARERGRPERLPDPPDRADVPPEAFSTYLRMPRVMAERRAIADGRTPHDVLLDQLDLMDRRLDDVADDIARHDSDKLLANGRFLAEKFGTSALQIDGTAGTTSLPAAAPTDAAAGAKERKKPPSASGSAERGRADDARVRGRPPRSRPVRPADADQTGLDLAFDWLQRASTSWPTRRGAPPSRPPARGAAPGPRGSDRPQRVETAARRQRRTRPTARLPAPRRPARTPRRSWTSSAGT